MNNEDEELAQKEWEAAMKEAIREEDALCEKLKAEGRYEGGLDGNAEDFAVINNKLKARLKEIQAKHFGT